MSKVTGIKITGYDPEMEKMVEVAEVCTRAKVSLPKEVKGYFAKTHEKFKKDRSRNPANRVLPMRYMSNDRRTATIAVSSIPKGTQRLKIEVLVED